MNKIEMFKEFNDNLKPDDILSLKHEFTRYMNLSFDFYEFIKFKECRIDHIYIGCKNCKGRYILKNTNTNEIFEKCDFLIKFPFEKVEPFITEEEFSV